MSYTSRRVSILVPGAFMEAGFPDPTLLDWPRLYLADAIDRWQRLTVHGPVAVPYPLRWALWRMIVTSYRVALKARGRT